MVGDLHGQDHDDDKSVFLVCVDADADEGGYSVEELYSVVCVWSRCTFLISSVLEEKLADELSWLYEAVEG